MGLALRSRQIGYRDAARAAGRRRVRAACASVLALLITLPFTAPFPTCDVALLLANGHPLEPLTAHHATREALAASPTLGRTSTLLEEESFNAGVAEATVGTVPLVMSAPSPTLIVSTISTGRTPLLALRL